MKNLDSIRRELKLFRSYAIITTIIWIAIFFLAFTNRNAATQFDEIEVKRINVVEEDGQVRMVISNQERYPDPIIDGETFTRQGRAAGIIFYNDEGDENGGIAFAGRGEEDDYLAYGGLFFDQFKQDQITGIRYMDNSGERVAGFQVWERPEISAAVTYKRYEKIESMPEGPEKEKALEELRELQDGLMFGASRVFVGRNKRKDAIINLADADGNKRIRMRVDSVGNPSLDFFDEAGNILISLPKDMENQATGRKN